MNIYVGNLSHATSEQQLVSLFSTFGMVRSAKLITDTYTGRSKGFAFVEMPDDKHAERAIRDLDNTDFDSRTIVVNEAKPRVERDRFSR